MAQIAKGRLVKGPYKPMCRDCAIYFSITVSLDHIASGSVPNPGGPMTTEGQNPIFAPPQRTILGRSVFVFFCVKGWTSILGCPVGSS